MEIQILIALCNIQNINVVTRLLDERLWGDSSFFSSNGTSIIVLFVDGKSGGKRNYQQTEITYKREQAPGGLCHVHVFIITSQLVALVFIPKATLRLGPLHYFRVATLLGSQSVRKVVSVAVQFYVKRWPLSSVCMFVQNIISLSCTIQNFLEGREGVPKEPSSPVFTS
jgi:hypothetical protein